jgi:4-hydroxy-tetrahydrodipicolinate synthase
VEVVSQVAKHNNIIGIKDSSGNLINYQDLIRVTPDNFNVIQGYGSLFLPSLILGGTATMSGEANVIAKIIVDIYKEFLKGDFLKARSLQFKVVTLLSVITYEGIPQGVKEAMNMIGLPGGYTLSPVAPLTSEEKMNLQEILISLGLLKSQK